MKRHGHLWWQSIVTAVALILSVGAMRPALGQNYKVIPPRVNEAQAKVLGGQVATILRNAAGPDAAAIKLLDDYFKGSYYPLMTSIDAEALGELAVKREKLFQLYINPVKSQGARDHLYTITLQAMGAIAKGPYHPAVRYNAALILGQLDSQPGVKALPAGTEALLTLLENEQFNKVAVPTAVKVAAIVSLQRHVRLGVEPPVAERISKAALAVANREELPEDASAKAYGWVRRQAAKVLAMQFEKGLTPPAYETFVRLVADEKMDLDDRCAIAGLLKPEMFSGAQGLDAEAMTQALGGLARKVLAFEAEEAGDYVDAMIGGGVPAAGGFSGRFEGGGGDFGLEGGRGGFGGGGGLDLNALGLEDQGPKYEKRRMIDRTIAIVAGAEALKAGGSDELKERLTEFSTMILEVAEAAAPENARNEDIAPSVVQLQEDVDRLVSNWAPAKAGAEEGAAEAGEELLEAPEEAPAEAPADEAAAAPAEAAGGN